MKNKYENGDEDQGQIENNMRNGKGIFQHYLGKYTFANRDTYDGEWKDNQMDGEGKFLLTQVLMYMRTIQSMKDNGRTEKEKEKVLDSVNNRNKHLQEW